ncbi:MULTISPECIES: ferric reductase-like transmembrane domain-containing protein [Nocardia]|uniref:Iron reductase n=2 Tax=Nocardia TaxID=1817 RepID=A0A2T2Z6E7_9NOCA|nr:MULTISPECIES: ferric reductase-like transmembrane domain-containing protein [Nocardia]MBF6448027.1 ferric reductase-like transmembrane domain-containing protein [Nocardia elegans]PSR63335.1 iron reductase [Nocardia nova]
MNTSAFDQALWAFGRAGGITALILLTVAAVAGIAARSGRAVLLPRAGLAEFHRGAALSATAFVALHVLAMLLDPYAQLRLLTVVVPFTGGYRPLWVGFGTLAVDLLAVVVITALLRHRLGPTVFRLAHWSVYALWPVALIHTLGSGSDVDRIWMLALVGACVLAVATAGVWRFSRGFTEFTTVPERSRR